jgi:hypothetical protein
VSSKIRKTSSQKLPISTHSQNHRINTFRVKTSAYFAVHVTRQTGLIGLIFRPTVAYIAAVLNRQLILIEINIVACRQCLDDEIYRVRFSNTFQVMWFGQATWFSQLCSENSCVYSKYHLILKYMFVKQRSSLHIFTYISPQENLQAVETS